MKLSTLLQPAYVRIGLNPGTHQELLEAVMRPMIDEPDIRSHLVTQMLQKDEEYPVTIGNGVAIPHLNQAPASRIYLGAAQLNPPMNLSGSDDEPVHLAFLVITPAGKSGKHLKILARISRMCHKLSILEQLNQASTPEEFIRIIADFESRYGEM